MILQLVTQYIDCVDAFNTSAEPPQILMQNSSLGITVDETEGLIKHHEAFEKLLSSQEDKVRSASVSY